MEGGVIVAFISLAGSLAGTFGGILTANKLTGYRIDQLEKKVDKMIEQDETNSVRLIKLEGRDEYFEEKFKVANHRIKDLENIARSNGFNVGHCSDDVTQ